MKLSIPLLVAALAASQSSCIESRDAEIASARSRIETLSTEITALSMEGAEARSESDDARKALHDLPDATARRDTEMKLSAEKKRLTALREEGRRRLTGLQTSLSAYRAKFVNP